MTELAIAESNVPVRAEGYGSLASREPERHLVPAVDIFETDDGLTLVADVPGVDREGLDVRVEEDMLTIRGRVCRECSGDATYEEYELLDYFRRFRLSDVVDRDRIEARIENGVLTLTLPKAEKARPRRIDVKLS